MFSRNHLNETCLAINREENMVTDGENMHNGKYVDEEKDIS
jgi:hypothetical protein